MGEFPVVHFLPSPLLFLSSNQKWKTRRIVAASNPCASRPELNMHERVRLISVSLLKIIQPADYRSPVVDCALCATNPRTKYRPVVRRIRFQSASSSPSTSSSFSFDRAYIVAVQLFTNWRGSPILSIVPRDPAISLSLSFSRSLARSLTHTHLRLWLSRVKDYKLGRVLVFMVSSRLEGSKYRLIIQVEKEVKKLEVKNVVVIG